MATVPQVLMAGALLVGVQLSAAPIPKLYSTGVKDDGTPLGNATKDPHYTLVESADTAFPGPDLFTLTPGFPVGPWLAEGPSSRWIAPRPQQGIGNNEGQYIIRTTFDLTGFDPNKAKITGKWAVDNSGADIVINGISTGLANNAGFGGFTDFTIETGFIEGVNTIEFVVINAPSGINPTGFRAELRGTVELPDEPPSVVEQPKALSVVAGEPITLSVTADGTPPLTYQWKRGTTVLEGATEATYTIEASKATDEGDYTVVITNGAGSKASDVAKVAVFDVIPGLFATGVDDARTVLVDGTVDTHYQLVINPDGATTEAFTQDTTLFPIVGGPWLLAGDQSAWIGPRADTSGAAGGDYTYRIQVDLTGLDPTTAFISGRWSSDNEGTLLLNGAATGLRNTAGFGTWTDFTITAGFLSGMNTIEFRINNAGSGYTGLRTQSLRGGARKKTGPAIEVPRIVAQPVGGTFLVGETATLRVVADSTVPMTYQWSRDGQPLVGKTEATLELANLGVADAASYVVNIRNSAGNTNSQPAVLRILERVGGVFSTGVDATGVVLDDGMVDPHYSFSTNATDSAVSEAVVHDSTIFPIVTGPWLANSAASKWIGPKLNTVDALGGDYAYKVSFDLTGFDPATAVVLGGWATDNGGTDIRLNGTSLGLLNNAQFSVLTPFELGSGFVAGKNTIEFLVNNTADGYTALRVEGLRVGAIRSASAPSVTIESTATGVRVAWPVSATGFRLTSAATLGGAWSDVNAPVIEVNGQNTVNLSAAADAAFFRLQK
jgi:hypothetical protein